MVPHIKRDQQGDVLVPASGAADAGREKGGMRIKACGRRVEALRTHYSCSRSDAYVAKAVRGKSKEPEGVRERVTRGWRALHANRRRASEKTARAHARARVLETCVLPVRVRGIACLARTTHELWELDSEWCSA